MAPRAYPEKSLKKIFTRGKRGQMKLSFGMIFSIILIIIFLAFAFYAIKNFLGLQDTIKIAQFGEKLQSDVNKAWNSGGRSSTPVEYYLPRKVEAVCFSNDDYENLRFDSKEFIQGKKIDHLDIEKIIGENEEFCIDNINGKVKMIIEKDYEDDLVIIKK